MNSGVGKEAPAQKMLLCYVYLGVDTWENDAINCFVFVCLNLGDFQNYFKSGFCKGLGLTLKGEMTKQPSKNYHC